MLISYKKEWQVTHYQVSKNMIINKSHSTTFLLALIIIPLAGAGVDIHALSLPSIIHYFHSFQTAVQTSVTLHLLVALFARGAFMPS